MLKSRNKSSHKKTIFFVLSSLGSGGAERVLLNVSKALSEKHNANDIKIFVVLLTNGDDFYIPEGCRIIRCNAKSVRHSLWQFAKLLFQYKPDSVISTLKHVTFFVGLMCRLFSIPHISRVANTISQEKDYGLKWKVFSKINYFFDRKIIAVSNGVRDDLHQILNVKTDKIITIPNPCTLSSMIDPDALYDHRHLKGKDKINLLFVGRLSEQKNIQFLLDVVKKGDGAFALTLVGEGPLRGELLENARDKNIDSWVNFVGPVQDVSEFYENADVMVLSSFYEGMPNVLIEALYFGLPIVSYNCPSGPKEIVKSAAHGCLLNSLNVDDFVASIHNVYRDDTKSRILERHEYIKDNFAIDVISERYLKELLSV